MTKKTSYIIDSFAWIEYFRGSSQGGQAASYIEGGQGFTPIVVIAELSAYYARQKISSWERDCSFIEMKAPLIDLTSEIAKRAGIIRQKMRENCPKFWLMDAIIYETALSLKAWVVSGDPHFEGLANVIFLKG